MDNIYFLRATKGDPVYDVFQFKDSYGNPSNLTGLAFSLAFKYQFSDQSPIFTLDFDNGMGYVDADPLGGQVYFNITDDQTDAVTIDATTKPGIPVPYTQIVSDLKIVLPSGSVLSTINGTRVKVFLTIEDNVS